MWSSDRTCNLCQTQKDHLEVHHINRNPSDNRYNNLILLCRNCHSQATTKGLGRKISPTLLKRYKRHWQAIVSKRRAGIHTENSELEETFLKAGAERLVTAFQDFMAKRDPYGVLSLFTPPRTESERDWVENYALGGGRPGDFVRLFASKGFGYKVVKYEIKSLRLLHTKRANVTVEEWRTWWDEGRWQPVPRRLRTRLTLVRIGTDWFVDKYSTQARRHKYGALE